MRKTIIKIIISLLLCLGSTININHLYHIHGEEIQCPYCRSTDVELISTTATCTEDGDATYRCLNTSHPNHAGGISSDPINTTFSGPKSKLGHDYHSEVTKDPTCKDEGTLTYECSRCGDSYNEEIPVVDHQYKKVIVKETTCTENGQIDYICIYCEKKYSETIKAYGHNFIEKENVVPTCIEDGHILKVCKRCNEEENTILKAIGHDVTLEIKKEPTCIEEGLKSGICKNCNEEIKETIPSLGHKYPEEWAIDKDSSIFKEGIKSKTCETCQEKIEEVIPKKEIPTIAYVGVSAAAIGGIALLVLKKKAAKKIAEKAVEEIAEKEILKPSFEERTIVTSLKDETFYRILKVQKYLKVIESEFESIKETIEENEPDLTIIDISDKNIKKVIKELKTIKKELDSPSISLLVSEKQIEKNIKSLDKLKNDEVIKDYIDANRNSNVILVKLVLPVMKPNLKSDEALENIGMVADALNIPGISSIIDTFITTREIKETYDAGKEEGLSFVDKSTIISDIASILHLDTVSSVAGLVGDLDDIKSSLQSKIGGNEINTTKNAVNDIIDVVSDIIDN